MSESDRPLASHFGTLAFKSSGRNLNMIWKKESVAPKKRSRLTPVAEERWEDERFLHTATALRQAGAEGISVRTAKKYDGRPMWRKSFWIQKDQSVESVLAWLVGSVKSLFYRYWQRNIVTEEDLRRKDSMIQGLRANVRTLEAGHEILRARHGEQERQLALAREVQDQVEKYKSVLKKFESKIATSAKDGTRIEEWVKNQLKRHRWLLGLDCEVRAKNKDIDPQTEIDLHVVSNYGEDRVFEIKSPNIPVFCGNPNRRFDRHPELSKGLSQLVEYLQRTQSYSVLRQRGVYGIDKPIGRILAGYSLDGDQRRLLADWNFYLYPAIRIMTYDDVIGNAKKELALLETVRKKT
jgi:hypothetical protein